MWWDGSYLNFCHFHSDTFWQVSLDILKEGVSSGASEMHKLHKAEVRTYFVLYPMLLVDVNRLEQCEAFMICFTRCPAGT